MVYSKYIFYRGDIHDSPKQLCEGYLLAKKFIKLLKRQEITDFKHRELKLLKDAFWFDSIIEITFSK